MVAKQRIRMANEKHSKNITQRGNVAKTLVSGGGGAAEGRARRAGRGGAGRARARPPRSCGPRARLLRARPSCGSRSRGAESRAQGVGDSSLLSWALMGRDPSGSGTGATAEARKSLPREELGLCLWETHRKSHSYRNS